MALASVFSTMAQDKTLKQGTGGLVAVPVRAITSATALIPAGFTSSSAISQTGDTSPFQPGGWVLSINAATPPGSIGVIFPFYGRRAGLLLKGDSNVGSSFDVLVDDRKTVEGDINVLSRGAIQSTLIDDYFSLPVAEGLPDDGPHEMQVWLRGSSGGTVSLRLRALLLEARMGYKEPPHEIGSLASAGLVPSSSTSITRGNLTAARLVRYRNEDTVTRTLTITDASANVLDVVTMATLTTYTLDLGQYIADLAFIKHSADVASKIRYWPVGVV